MRIDVHDLKRRAQRSLRQTRRPEVEGLVVRVEDGAGHGLCPIQAALLLEKADDLRVVIRLCAAFRRALTQRREWAGVRQKEIHVEIEYLHGQILRSVMIPL